MITGLGLRTYLSQDQRSKRMEQTLHSSSTEPEGSWYHPIANEMAGTMHGLFTMLMAPRLQPTILSGVNDSNSDALAASSNSLTPELSGSRHLSGVEYYISGNVRYKVAVSNAYRNVYDNTAISFETHNCSIASQAKPTIGGGEDHTKVLHLTGAGSITATTMLTSSVTAGVDVTHPFKANLSDAGNTVN